MDKAKFAVFTGANLPYEIREYGLTPPPPGMAKLRLCASGICGTDLHTHSGGPDIKPPLAMGHEFIGTVEMISDEDSAKYGISKGDKVISDIAIACGKCECCRNGDEANCMKLSILPRKNSDNPPHFWGGYGEYNYSPVSNLIKLPLSLDPKIACVFACAGPMLIHAFSLAARSNFSVKSVNSAVVQGFDALGAFSVFYLSLMGIRNITVLASNGNENQKSLAHSLGASRFFSIDEIEKRNLHEYLSSQIGGAVDIVLETSGNHAALPVGLQLLRNRGLYLVLAQYANHAVPIDPQLITSKSLQIMGSWQYSVFDVKAYLNLMEHTAVYHPLISSLAAEFPFSDLNNAIEHAASGKSIKTILV